MDFTQLKLTKAEWATIEVPVSASEKHILDMIIQGYTDVNIRSNETQSMYSFIKINQTPETEYYLYKKYFESTIIAAVKKYGKNTPLIDSVESSANSMHSGGELKTLRSADMIRIQNLDNNVNGNAANIFEYLLIDLFVNLLTHIHKSNKKYAFYLYTLIQLTKTSIRSINKYVMDAINIAIEYANSITEPSFIISNAYEFIERNTHLLKYEDKTLFPHQKELFTICRRPTIMVGEEFTTIPQLIMYMAPTGTGKTLSPIGLTSQYRIIFVCVARHIGLALAKAAISMEKKVAFAFGCETASDIRLHYFSAINYTKNKRSGGIGKVDNSVGDNVEIMICDVQSYLVAMYYMMSFNPKENIIMFWDEPTITLDYTEHPLHAIIQRNWRENQIPTVILSCATLPPADELQPVFDNFRERFDGAEIHTVTSFDCRKSIPILNKSGFCVLPHYLYSDYSELYQCARYCSTNKTVLRYFDLSEIIRFIDYIDKNDMIIETYSVDCFFSQGIADITMNRLKEYYLELLMHLDTKLWSTIYRYMLSTREKKFNTSALAMRKAKSLEQSSSGNNGLLHPKGALSRMASISIIPIPTPTPQSSAATTSGISITTTDAYTLTDGPTIFLAEDVQKIGCFCIQQSNIAASVFQTILSKITRNADVMSQIDTLESLITAKETKVTSDDSGKSKSSLNDRMCKESLAWVEQINKLRKEIRLVSLDPEYIPNTRPHQELWSPTKQVYEDAFVSNIGEDMAKMIMLLNIDNNLKVLLLLGIGMFVDTPNAKYMEIMKQLADEQRLYIIIASTDYVYGTNYQFCHGFIGKDLTNMTQQKTLQAMGRIGRNNIQQQYTIRFRDDDMIMRLFSKPEHNLEAQNMCALFA